MTKKKRKRAPGGGAKKGSGIKSSIKHEWRSLIADKLEHGTRESITLLRKLMKDYERRFGPYHSNRYRGRRSLEPRPLDIETLASEQGTLRHHLETVWLRHLREHERAVLLGDADWFRHQAEALKGRYRSPSPSKGQFDKAVFMQLYYRAHSYDSPMDQFASVRGEFFYGCTAAGILESLKKERCPTDSQPDRIKVEGYYFANRESCCEAIRSLAKLLGFKLRSEQGKHSTD